MTRERPFQEGYKTAPGGGYKPGKLEDGGYKPDKIDKGYQPQKAGSTANPGNPPSGGSAVRPIKTGDEKK